MSDSTTFRRQTIGLVIDTLAGSGSYQEDIWRTVAETCRQAGTGLLIFPGGALRGSPFITYEYMRNVIYGLIRKECVDGVILAIGNIVSLASREDFSAFAHSFGGMPVVNIGFGLDEAPGVVVDNANAFACIIEHLVADHRCKKVAFIRGPEKHEDAIERFRAYQTVLKKHGLPFDPALTHIGNFSEQSGAQAIAAWLERKIDFDCVAASGDYMAIGAVKELISRGKRVPQDVAVTGFDDIYEAGILSPGLTTIRQPLPEQMRKAVAVLMAMMEGKPRHNRIFPIEIELKKRRSCGCGAATLDAAAALPARSGMDRGQWLAEVSRSLAAGFREQPAAETSRSVTSSAPRSVTSSELLDLFTAFFDEVEGRRADVFVPEWEKFFGLHFKHNEGGLPERRGRSGWNSRPFRGTGEPAPQPGAQFTYGNRVPP
jgi:sigma-B regulation protein RsbU (phosphoserine phosphatase)